MLGATTRTDRRTNSYADEDAQKAHLATEYFGEFAKTLRGEDLLRGELTLKIVKRIGGFVSR